MGGPLRGGGEEALDKVPLRCCGEGARDEAGDVARLGHADKSVRPV